MTTAAEYLDAAKAKLGIESDYALAKAIEQRRMRISDWRKGRTPIPPVIAVKLAIILDMDPSTVIANLEMERETDPKLLAFWRDFLSRARAAVAGTLVAVFTAIALTAGGANLGGAATSAFLRRWRFA